MRAEWASDQTWSVFHCKACDHRFLDPYPTETVLLQYYSSKYTAYSASHGLNVDQQITVAGARKSGYYRHIAVNPGVRILDVGCGGGSFLAVCRELGADVQGVEPSAEGVKTCQDNDVPVFHGTMTEFLKQGNAPYDFVTANHMLEHHPNPVQLLQEMASILTTDGQVWISVPNAGCYFARKLKGNWHSADLPVHLQHFSIRSLMAALNAANLSVRSCRTESENSLPGSLAAYIKQLSFIPHKVTHALFGAALRKDAWLGRRIDESRQGEAILVAASIN